MLRKFTIAVFEGDGIGPEVIGPTVEILARLAEQSRCYQLSFDSLPAGAAHFLETGESLPKTSLEAARDADAILLSAMGLPDVRHADGTEITPQVQMSEAFELFAGVRPVRVPAPKVSAIKIPRDKTVDFVMVRENTEGLFFSQAKGDVGPNTARETLQITRKTSQALFAFAFDLAERRKKALFGSGTVTCVDKANVFRAFAFFRAIFDAEATNHPALRANHAYVDALALWMVQKPWEFDVLVTENMFGEILADLGAGLMGGLGMAPSADIGRDHAIFQPCHGSAPDLAGTNTANPFAMILSGAMMLDWLGARHGVDQMTRDAERLRAAIDSLMGSKTATTRDLGGKATTLKASAAVAARLEAPEFA